MLEADVSLLKTILIRALNIAIIIGVSYFILSISERLIRRLLTWGDKYTGRREVARRLNTLVPLLRSLLKYVIIFFAAILILRQLGVDATAILAGAGIVGVAVGFGAQTLVKDILTGVFLLLEDSISVGDTVQIGDISGTVEDIGLRVTRIRPFSGALIIIPNGEISRIANYNRGFTRAIVEIRIAYEADIDRATSILEEIAKKYHEEHPEKILEPAAVHRIVRLDSSGVVLRLVLKVAPNKHWDVERDMLYLIKKTFDQENIEIPYQKHIVYIKEP
ncbi:MAG TPA: mechanosensitive ion channel family protein [Candidatus Atribacteria bacterium]|nr:mechanosensitive ion channel family protein [Candidatus Atribacteria bacterium]